MSFGGPGSGYPGQQQWPGAARQAPWPGGQWGPQGGYSPPSGGFGAPGPAYAWHGQPQTGAPVPGQQFPPPGRRRIAAPLILGALGVVLLAIVGLILYSLFGGPDYQNDDYVPPPPGEVKPIPDLRVSEVDQILTANELYAQQLATPIRCELTIPDLNLETATDSEVKTYIDDLMACTMRVWDQPVRGTNRFELVRPVVNVYSDRATTPCGTAAIEGANAAYCLPNQQVYYGRSLVEELPFTAKPHVIDAIMAHEFGHAMQHRTLISTASYFSQRRADEATELELNRRQELQADCFAGMFVQAVTQSVPYDQQNVNDIMEAFRLIAGDVRAGRPGDPRAIDNHGQGQSRLYWTQVGLSGTDIGRCNTFTAPSEFVR